MHIPSTIGLPTILLHNFFTRAESDLLSSCVAMYKYAEKKLHPYAIILKNFLQIPTDKMATRAMLLNDPYSLPLFKPVSTCKTKKNSTTKVNIFQN